MRQTKDGKRAMQRAVMLASVLLLVLAPLASGQTANEAPVGTEVGAAEANGVPANEVERWWGAAGAVLCGIEARLMIRAPAIGFNPYAIAAGLAGCALAALDVMTTN